MSVLPGGFGSSGAAPSYQIGNSVRFRASASAGLIRTPSVNGNLTTWTWSGWVKRGSQTTDWLFTAGSTVGPAYTPYTLTAFDGNRVQFDEITPGPTVVGRLLTSTDVVVNDRAAWYHFVYVWDTGNLTATDRMRIYINGVRLTNFAGGTVTNPTTSLPSQWNTTAQHSMVRFSTGLQFGDLYLAEINFIGGQALDASSFGQFDSNGVWTPKEYTGTYGTNGFYLKFDNGSTASNLGLDSSGNGNDWTVLNVSVTAGPSYDWMTDTPTNNYAVLNPLNEIVAAGSGGVSLSECNLRLTGPAAANSGSIYVSTLAATTGKWYAEMTLVSVGTANSSFGIISAALARNYSVDPGAQVNLFSTATGVISKNGTTVQSSLAACSANDVIGIAVDLDAGTLQFYRNNAAYGSLVTGLTAANYVLFSYASRDSLGSVVSNWTNFGQRPFAYTPPAGFVALRTSNLPSAPLAKGADHFDVALYTGNQTARNITGFAFQPDFVWIKARSSALRGHTLFDVARGATKYLVSNSTSQEVTVAQSLTSFTSDGFSLGTAIDTNESGQTFVGWSWRANGATVTNTAGSISSQVSANPAAGISVVTYTGTGANATVGHGLGIGPAFLIVKRTDSNGLNWIVWHSSLVGTEYLLLDSPNAKATGQPAVWNSTIPASTVFSVGTNTAVNASGGTYVAYCFAQISGFSKFGTYTGNGSADGPFVYCGFRPRYVMMKCSSSDLGASAYWVVKDAERSPNNVALANLYPNLINAEDTTATASIDLLSNGFKIRGTYTPINSNTNTIIYIAFAENPFGGSNVNPANAR